MVLHWYSIMENLVCDEDQAVYTIMYGIQAINPNGEIVKCYSNIFFDKKDADSFVKVCNEGQLSLIHLEDVIEDRLSELYEHRTTI